LGRPSGVFLLHYTDQQLKKVDILIKLGLGDQEHLAWYRKVLLEPEAAVKDVRIRQYVSPVIVALVHMMMSDDILYNRVKALLMRKKKKQLPENLTDDAMKALVEKSAERDVPLDVLVEVYQRGFYEEGRDLDPDQNGFNRVNSFLSGGKALDLDRDLLDEYYSIEEAAKATGKKKPTRRYNPVLRVVGKILKASLVNVDNNKPTGKKLT
jgi:hypothetical protein